tara:strand:+ start:998 stop:2701 length:1704 start_codon:yes stop_codon:yes gene_type:complete
MIQITLTKKIFRIFTKQEKLLFFFLILSQFISAGLELLSIGSLLPIFKSVTDPSWNAKYFGFISEENRVIYIFLIVIFIFIVKNIFLVLLSYFTGKFRNKVSLRIINTIFNSYLNKEYQFHINNHSSILLRNMQYADGIDSTLMRLVNFYADLILAIMSVIAVSFLDFKVTLVAMTFLILILILYAFVTKLTVQKYGEDTVNYNTSYLKNMMEGIKSYREILLSGNQNYFTKLNSLYKEQSLRFKLRFQIIELIPKYIVELFFITSILAISSYFIVYDNINLYEYLPFIGVLMLGIIKLLPNILRIFSSYQQFKYLIPQIEIVYKSLYDAKYDDELSLTNTSNNKFNFEKDIVLKNVSFNYDKKFTLNNINIKINKNLCIGIQGESGSGKSTILNILSGLLLPSEGSILIDGQSRNLSNRNWQNKIGYVSQNTRLIDDTIRSNITFGSNLEKIDDNDIKELIEKSGLTSYIDSLPKGLETIVGENGVKISGGQAQRVGLARAFFNNPEILILDEPTNSLDKENENKIIDTLKKIKGQVTLIIVSHDAKPLEISDIKFTLKKGELYKE